MAKHGAEIYSVRSIYPHLNLGYTEAKVAVRSVFRYCVYLCFSSSFYASFQYEDVHFEDLMTDLYAHHMNG